MDTTFFKLCRLTTISVFLIKISFSLEKCKKRNYQRYRLQKKRIWHCAFGLLYVCFEFRLNMSNQITNVNAHSLNILFIVIALA